MTKIPEMTIHELHRLLTGGEISSVEATRAVLDRIGSVEEKIHSFVSVLPEVALEQAKAADAFIKEKKKTGEPVPPLTGVPLAIKDNLLTTGTKTTCASKILHNFIPPYDSTAVGRLKSQKAVFVGKANMDEFAMGSSTETSHFGVTRNPWNTHCIPGGSSGGSCTAVASDSCIGALGTDTGGSIRQPASHCSVVGMKPTYGRVSRYGVIAYASSLDQVGPITKDVQDNAILLGAIAGYDPNDSTSVDTPVPDYSSSLGQGVKDLRIGIPKEYFSASKKAGEESTGISEDVSKSVRDAIKLFGELGAKCEEVSLPHTQYAVPVYYLIATAEASSNLARYDGVRYGHRSSAGGGIREMYKASRAEGFGMEVKRRIMLGTYALSAGYYDAYYKKAQQVRTLIVQDFKDVLKDHDLILTPVAPTPAFKIGEKTADPLEMYLSDIFTISLNLTGLPGMSQPCGFSSDGLPIGMQLIANYFNEGLIYRAAQAFEQATDWHLKKPEI